MADDTTWVVRFSDGRTVKIQAPRAPRIAGGVLEFNRGSAQEQNLEAIAKFNLSEIAGVYREDVIERSG